MDDTLTQPDYITQAQLEFLDKLRDSGVTNMYGATPYLINEFDVDFDVAVKILAYWMKTFGVRHPTE